MEYTKREDKHPLAQITVIKFCQINFLINVNCSIVQRIGIYKYLQYRLFIINIVESGIKHHNPNPSFSVFFQLYSNYQIYWGSKAWTDIMVWHGWNPWPWVGVWKPWPLTLGRCLETLTHDLIKGVSLDPRGGQSKG
jgi:hypothetical protein